MSGARGAALAEYNAKRDFARTPEPAGAQAGTAERRAEPGRLAFVIQKHEATRLHYDLRLELGGVMLSWAVPRGPSLDPAEKRLAVQTEEHPMDYNVFEGVIPEGEYGGGAVMLWDRGHYWPESWDEDVEARVREGLEQGRLSFWLQGARLQGGWTLVRKGRSRGPKSEWLLIKRDDLTADPDSPLPAAVTTSVASGRTMAEIASEVELDEPPPAAPAAPPAGPARPAAGGIEPMLPQQADALPEGKGWVYEPKYDGVRVIGYATPEGAALMTRNGLDKARQFPDVADELRALSRARGEPLVLDGELVARTPDGGFGGFGDLQPRIHLQDAARIRQRADELPVCLVVFDLLVQGERALPGEAWTQRRQALEQLADGLADRPHLALGASTPDGWALLERARAERWEGVVAKRADSPYRPGERSNCWRKLVLRQRHECVVGGWTEPRRGRTHLGSLLLGMHNADGALEYVGHTGSGLDRETRKRLRGQLEPMERERSPFASAVRPNQTPHWTEPQLVVEVESNGWTTGGKLRQPSFVGVRDDKPPAAVLHPDAERGGGREVGTGTGGALDTYATVVEQLRRREQSGRDGMVRWGEGAALRVTNLDKTYYPDAGDSKGDLLRYYAQMAPLILPCMKDRPLVLKRYPDGIRGESFYQQSAPDEVPAGVRVEPVQFEEDDEPRQRLVGGNLQTLLYTVQLGALSYDPWHSRIGHLDTADYTILDLDPGAEAPWERVVQVARWVKDELDRFGLHGALKTSGSSGLHVYLPLPDGTPLEAATLIAQIVATRVAGQHPEQATVERMTRNRAPDAVYVDYLQNIRGKTVAGVYAARAKPGATVSTPLAWDELVPELDRTRFTIRTVPERVRQVGDLWGAAMRTPNSLERLLSAGGGA